MKTSKTLKHIIAYVPSIIILCIIFGFSSQNGQSSGHLSAILFDYLNRFIHLPIPRDVGILLLRKGAHMSEFALLTLSLDYAFHQNEHKHIYVKALLLCMIFACLDEWHQTMIDGRAGVFTDVMIDTCGGLLVQLGLLLKKH